MRGSQDVSTGVLWLPPSQSIPPHQHPHQLGQPMWHLCLGTPHPTPLRTCWLRVLPCWPGSEGGAVLCRVVPSGLWRCCSLHTTAGRTGRVTRLAPSPH